MDGRNCRLRRRKIGGAYLHSGGAQRERCRYSSSVRESSRRDHRNADGVDDLRQERNQAGLAPYVLGIKSQAHEGWKLVRERYDDAGFSGGSMERPALQKLLDDVRARKIDVIVVWGWISARIRRCDRLQLSRNDPFVMARAMPALSRARRSRGKSRVDSFETRISYCGARAANHKGTTRPAPRAARRRSSGAGSRWPTAPRQQFPRSASRSPSRRPEGGSRETVSIPSRIPGLQSGPRPLPALAGLVPEPVVVGGLVGRPARREGRRAQPAWPGLRQDVERRPVRRVRRRRCGEED